MKRLLLPAATLMLPLSIGAQDMEEFSRHYTESVRPFYESGAFGSFAGVGGVEISYAKFERPDDHGALVIVPGKSGAHVRWAEFMYDAKEWGYSIYVMDHRGMGMSGRLLDDAEKTHIDEFSNYVTDLKTFVDTVVNQRRHERRYLFAHSMGSIVAALYLADAPSEFDAAAFNAPMFTVETGMPNFLARAVTGVLSGFAGDEYAPTQGPWSLVPFEENVLTHSEARYRRWEELDIHEHPVLAPGGTTNRWVNQSLKYSRRARLSADQIRIPLLLFSSGKDSFVKNRGIEEFFRRAPDCEIVFYEDAYHIVPIEIDTYRSDQLRRVEAFFTSRL